MNMIHVSSYICPHRKKRFTKCQTCMLRCNIIPVVVIRLSLMVSIYIVECPRLWFRGLMGIFPSPHLTKPASVIQFSPNPPPTSSNLAGKNFAETICGRYDLRENCKILAAREPKRWCRRTHIKIEFDSHHDFSTFSPFSVIYFLHTEHMCHPLPLGCFPHVFFWVPTWVSLFATTTMARRNWFQIYARSSVTAFGGRPQRDVRTYVVGPGQGSPHRA